MEDVTLQIGTFSVTIPAGSFKHKPNGGFDFKGVINDVKLKAQIVPLGNNIFTSILPVTGMLSNSQPLLSIIVTVHSSLGNPEP
jgi:hypothetical protein